MDDGMEVDNQRGGVDFDALQAAPGPSTGPGTSTGGLSYVLTSSDQLALLAELERKSRARTLAVPTNDVEVRNRLREMGEPMTLFGEGKAERRERLRYVVSQLAMAKGWAQGAGGEGAETDSDEESEEEEKVEEFYTPGDDDLLQARRFIAGYSLERSKRRIARQKVETKLSLGEIIDFRKSIYAELKTYTLLGSQIGSKTRPLSVVRFSPDSSILATASWSGEIKLWDIPSANERSPGDVEDGLVDSKGSKLVNGERGGEGKEDWRRKAYKGHTERIGGLAWHPRATMGQERSALNFATGAADSEIKLWSLSDPEPLSTLTGHSGRVCRVAFHPSGRYLASASYDQTWRLWDVETSKELLLQEGHSKEVYAIAVQDDGALVCSGGLDAVGRVWDLRTGRTAMVLDRHARDILSIDFSPNGYQIATASSDDTIHIWDIRQLRQLTNIPAHTSSVSDVRFFRADFKDGQGFPFTRRPAAATNGDGVKKEEDGGDIKMEEDEEQKPAINGLNSASEEKEDVKPIIIDQENEVKAPISGLYLVSSGYDGFVKIWSADDWNLIKGLKSEAGGKTMSCDVAGDGKFIASGEYARTFKLWASENVEL